MTQFDSLYKQLQDMSAELDKTDAKNKNLQLEVKQNKSFQKLNQLLEKSAKQLTCGPDCQHDKKAERLKQNYQDAELNVDTAPAELEQARKKYYIFSKGEAYYDNFKEKELQTEAAKLTKEINNAWNEEIAKCDTLNAYYETELINKEHIDDLYTSFREKSEHLRSQLHDKRGDILTNQRKTYYENEEIYNLQKWGKSWTYIYYFILICLIFCWGMKTPWTIKNLIIMAVKITLLGLYPYYIYSVGKWTWEWILFFVNMIPYNIYTRLNSS